MPNHVKNRIILSGSLPDIDAIIKAFGIIRPQEIEKTHDGKWILKSEGEDYRWFDQKTNTTVDRKGNEYAGIPIGYEVSLTEPMFIFPDFKLVIPPPDTDAYRDLPNQREAEKDPTWWYRWNIDNWGTKWGGYSYERLSINSFTFETAWSSVPVIIEKMSKQFPTVMIEYSWSDEDFGYNVGESVYLDGLLTENIPDGGTIEAYEIAFKLRPERKEDYKLVDGEYQYIES